MRPLVFLLGAAAAVQAQYTNFLPRVVDEDLPPIPNLTKRGQSNEPCAKVADLWTTQQAKNSTARARVPAELAYQCLQTVPVDVDGDVQEIQELKEFLQYQSTLAWLKTGVEGQIKPLDLLSSLDDIASKVKSGKYKSDYEVQFAIRSLLDSVGDFHLMYIPDMTGIFAFARPGLSLVSISEDGLKLPKIFIASDLLSGKAPSPVLTINGKNASDYVEQVSGNSYHDVDARYNNVFPNPALAALGADGGGLFTRNYNYEGANTTLTFANGTTKTIDNVAFIASVANFTGVTDGPSFFEEFCHNDTPSTDDEDSEDEGENLGVGVAAAIALAGPLPTTSSLSSSRQSPVSTATLKSSSTAVFSRPANLTASLKPTSTPTSKVAAKMTAYPYPVFINGDATFSGYYLNDSDYKDVAVLAVPSFDTNVEDPDRIPQEAGFLQTQSLLRKFFTDTVKQGKKKLVIDLRGNGGGTIDLSFEFFKQLFPNENPWGASRYRAHEAFHYYSAIVADLAVNGTNVDGFKDPEDLGDGDYGVSSVYLWSNILNANGTQYKNFADYWGPYGIQNDTFTGIRRYNFSNNDGGHTLTTSLTGYDGQATPSQPFQPENIIIVQDGLCGSACAIFSELMREQGKVQTIVMGGRPQNAPMQGVGGSKGSQVLSFDAIYSYAALTIASSEALDGSDISQMLSDTTSVGRIFNSSKLAERSFPSPGQTRLGGVNSLNNERQNDASNTPLEFIYEAADCRLFYTNTTYTNVVSLWKQIVDTTWGTGECVQGSTGDKSAIGIVTNKPFGLGQKSDSPSSTSAPKPHSAAAGLNVSTLFTLLAATASVVMVTLAI